MNQIGSTHLAHYTGSIQVHENNPMFLHTIDFRVQLYAWSILITNDLQDTTKLYGLVSVKSCTISAR